MGGGSTWQPSTESPLCAPGWFCLPGQRQLLLEENPGAFDLRLPASLSHLERGVQAWLPFPTKGLDPVIPLLPLLATCPQELVSLPSLVMPQGPLEVCSQMPPTLRLDSWSFSSHTRVSSTVLTRSTTQPDPRHRTHTQPQATLPTTEQIPTD